MVIIKDSQSTILLSAHVIIAIFPTSVNAASVYAQAAMHIKGRSESCGQQRIGDLCFHCNFNFTYVFERWEVIYYQCNLINLYFYLAFKYIKNEKAELVAWL